MKLVEAYILKTECSGDNRIGTGLQLTYVLPAEAAHLNVHEGYHLAYPSWDQETRLTLIRLPRVKWVTDRERDMECLVVARNVAMYDV